MLLSSVVTGDLLGVISSFMLEHVLFTNTISMYAKYLKLQRRKNPTTNKTERQDSLVSDHIFARNAEC